MPLVESYPETFARFTRLAREKTPDETMMALIIDSPWMPDYAGLNTLDFYFDPASWLGAYQKALDSFDQLGLDYEASRVGLALAQYLVEHGDHERARCSSEVIPVA